MDTSFPDTSQRKNACIHSRTQTDAISSTIVERKHMTAQDSKTTNTWREVNGRRQHKAEKKHCLFSPVLLWISLGPGPGMGDSADKNP